MRRHFSVKSFFTKVKPSEKPVEVKPAPIIDEVIPAIPVAINPPNNIHNIKILLGLAFVTYTSIYMYHALNSEKAKKAKQKLYKVKEKVKNVKDKVVANASKFKQSLPTITEEKSSTDNTDIVKFDTETTAQVVTSTTTTTTPTGITNTNTNIVQIETTPPEKVDFPAEEDMATDLGDGRPEDPDQE